MIKVLIVDDDFMVARIHTGFVAAVPGFEVCGVAHTGAQALAEVRRITPDLVLLDIHLPDIGGLELLRGLREVVPELDVLVISAAREADTVRSALRGGIVHYLMKPFTRQELAARLEHYAATYRPLDDSHTAEQADIDRVFGLAAARSTPTAKLPKGFSTETLQRVQDLLPEADGDISASEAAEALGTSRVSARRYLEYLTETGQAGVRLRYGAGRPQRRYSRAPGVQGSPGKRG